MSHYWVRFGRYAAYCWYCARRYRKDIGPCQAASGR